MNILTMAMPINVETWPVVAALLPMSFAVRPLSEVHGSMIVINEPALPGMGAGRSNTLQYVNRIYTRDDFDKKYFFGEKEKKHRFRMVELR